MFLGAVCLLYPSEKIDLKQRIGALLVFAMIYFGTYLTFIISWYPPGKLIAPGVQARYFFPAFSLIPMFLGINHMSGDKTKINAYLIILAIAFISFRIIKLVALVY